ncbi:MAG TPA: protein kinase [Terriglobales bacterium]|nr:protein kinase [Terriglobales bacterium]
MQRIALTKGEWFYDPSKPLGRPGGFGAVYEGVSEVHGALAVKRLHLTADDAAHREMRIASDLSGRNLNYVIPVLDAGQDADSGAYFVVMPKAEKSLQVDIDRGVTLTDTEATRVLLDITNGLIEVKDIVHRDLKPANILFHAKQWKVADFGIARFLEESTSLETLKGCLSPHYAAPEQWEYIHATSATDVYALGCIGYALITGQPPFLAAEEATLREQHLHADPPALPAKCSPRLRTLLSMMLRKSPNARPTLERVRKVLHELTQAPPPGPPGGEGLQILAEAGADVARAEAEAERMRQQELSQTKARELLAKTGRTVLLGILERLKMRIQRDAPNAEIGMNAIILGQGCLEVPWKGYRPGSAEGAWPTNAFPNSKWDVVAADEMIASQQRPHYRWSASLWYCRLPDTSDYRWYEASYFSLRPDEGPAPFSLTDRPKDADLAAAPIMHLYQLAFGPSAIDDEDEDDFTERWAALLALASRGKLGHPRNLPLSPKFWRQGFVA